MEGFMTTAQAIFCGAALIAACVIIANGFRPAAAELAAVGPYQLMHHSNTSANSSVFKLNSLTGEISFCYVTANSDVVCTHPVK